jgi:ADP-ribose pyrophosphatase YjhB (NUDIX family)
VTPKIDVRGAVFKEDKILMVRETVDGNKWTLPGGWGDIGVVPSVNAEREVLEETGIKAKAIKLAAVYDRNTHAPTPSQFTIYKLMFICEYIEGEPTPSFETSEVQWFAAEEVPDESEMEPGRTRRYHVLRMFEHYQNPELPTDFD